MNTSLLLENDGYYFRLWQIGYCTVRRTRPAFGQLGVRSLFDNTDEHQAIRYIRDEIFIRVQSNA